MVPLRPPARLVPMIYPVMEALPIGEGFHLWKNIIVSIHLLWMSSLRKNIHPRTQVYSPKCFPISIEPIIAGRKKVNHLAGQKLLMLDVCFTQQTFPKTCCKFVETRRIATWLIIHSPWPFPPPSPLDTRPQDSNHIHLVQNCHCPWHLLTNRQGV